MNAKMPELKRAFELAGFTDVKTVLSSGNVVFSARPALEPAIERKAEAAMAKHLGRSFLTIVRDVDALRELLESDPYHPFRLKAGSKRVVTFLREKPKRRVDLPVSLGHARILCAHDREVFTTYVRDPNTGPDFMTLIEKTFGKDVTTRTWETIQKVAR
jgi:uncharacterized protein (DUF1697 family)